MASGEQETSDCGSDPSPEAHDTTASGIAMLLDRSAEAAYLFEARRDETGAIDEFVFTYVNRAGETQLGRPREALLGAGLAELYPFHKETDLFDQYVRVHEEGTTLSREIEIPDLPTGTMWYLQRVFRTDVGIGIHTRDVTHDKLAEKAHRELEQHALHAQQMKSLGMLAGGVAHDFNNILLAIGGFAEMAQRRPDDPDRVEQALTEIRRATARAADLTKQLMVFSGRQRAPRKPLCLDTLIAGSARLIKNVLHTEAHLKLDLGASDAHVVGDETQLLQILINLAVNARDAMPNGGDLTITTTTRLLEPGAQPLVPGEPHGEYVRLCVSDEGEGMDEATRRRIFEPFFTTKDVGEGTGLGLAVVFSVVREHGGLIAVESAREGGTRFLIDLPVTQDTAAEPDPTPPPGPAEGRGETILIVDDEEPVRVLIASALERAGYRTLVAGGGREALAVYRRCASEVSAVLLDVVMPEMNGYDTFLALREVEPRLRVLFSTGFERDVFPPGFFEEGTHALLRKPYDIATLLRSVRAVLDADSPG